MPAPDPRLQELLTECLREQGLAMAGGRISIGGHPAKVQAVWLAFQAFAAAPAERLYQGLRIPVPGRRDVDRVGFETRLTGRPATPNLPAAPPSAWLSRTVYLVDGDDEYQGSDEAALHFVLEPGHPAEDFEEAALFGAGGPQSRQTGREPGLPLWFRQVEASPAWQRITGRRLDFVEVA